MIAITTMDTTTNINTITTMDTTININRNPGARTWLLQHVLLRSVHS